MKYEVKSWHEVVDTDTGLSVTGRKHLEEAQEIADLLNAEGKRVAEALNDEAARVLVDPAIGQPVINPARNADLEPEVYRYTAGTDQITLSNGQDKETI
jgi:hypothetical protein